MAGPQKTTKSRSTNGVFFPWPTKVTMVAESALQLAFFWIPCKTVRSFLGVLFIPPCVAKTSPIDLPLPTLVFFQRASRCVSYGIYDCIQWIRNQLGFVYVRVHDTIGLYMYDTDVWATESAQSANMGITISSWWLSHLSQNAVHENSTIVQKGF